MSKHMTAPPPQFPSFDQIVKGNVTIKKLSEHRYRITFSKIGKFLMYQVWDKDSEDLNKKRVVEYVSAKKWVEEFKKYNEHLEDSDSDSDKPLFTPTTIMEMEDDHNFAFIIKKAYFNSHGQVVLTVSTKEISLQNNTSEKLVLLPEGKLNNVRFDIDVFGGGVPSQYYAYWNCMQNLNQVPIPYGSSLLNFGIYTARQEIADFCEKWFPDHG